MCEAHHARMLPIELIQSRKEPQTLTTDLHHRLEGRPMEYDVEASADLLIWEPLPHHSRSRTAWRTEARDIGACSGSGAYIPRMAAA
jgi:hypothetical protein